MNGATEQWKTECRPNFGELPRTQQLIRRFGQKLLGGTFREPFALKHLDFVKPELTEAQRVGLFAGFAGFAAIIRVEEPFAKTQILRSDLNQLIGPDIFQREFQCHFLRRREDQGFIGT